MFGGKSLEKAVDSYHKCFSDKIEKKIKEADLICDHIFDLLGSGPRKLSPGGEGYKDIDWHSDFKKSYCWDPKTFYRDIPFGHIEGVDIKVPWELSRFQYLNVLGQAYVLTGNKKYSNEFADQITDWTKNNPYCFGVNWKCAMDVAIRAVNWLVAMEYFSEKGLFSEEFLKGFYNSIYEHGKYIRGHLEYASGWTTNHYLADIAGLFFISVYCPFFRESREWQEFSFQELHKEVDKQVYSDGCCFETSTSYHRLVLEMFFYSELLGQRAGINFSENYIKKIKKMFEASLYFIKPNGMIPQIGDNDSGRFLKYSKRHVLEHKYLLSLAAIGFKDSNFKLKNEELDEEAFWVFGNSADTVWNNLPSIKISLGSKSFPDAGWYILRHENDYCLISCGSNGGDGWHAHNDKLSFELMLDGQDVIVDPGTYVYTPYPDERNKFRSTEYHNTIKFNGYEQNKFPENGIFSLPERAKIKRAELEEHDDRIAFYGEVRYEDIIHSRVITLDKETREWKITDSFSCPNPVSSQLIFHLSPDVTFYGNRILTKDKEKEMASMKVEGYEVIKDKYDYSPEYGVKLNAEKLTAYMPVTQKKQYVITRIFKACYKEN